jgi:hydroxyacylglutathione hydrolase
MNQLLARLSDTREFARHCLDLRGLPAVPPYWSRMRKQNQEGPPLLGVVAEPPALSVTEFGRHMDEGAIVLDCRSPEAFAGGHAPGALNVGVGPSFLTWAGSVLPPDARVVLVLDSAKDLPDVTWDLLRIGYDIPRGWLAGGMLAWRTAAKPIAMMETWTVWQLDERLAKDRDLFVLDVRQPKEWTSGHIPGATQVTGADLVRRMDEIPRDRPIVTICGSGYRSGVAASALLRAGFGRVRNVLGGMTAWTRAGLPTTTDTGS